MYLLDGTALVATADFITPVCDDPRRYGRVAAANSISDVYAMGGEPLLVLNLCCFPERGVPDGVLAGILGGAAEVTAEAGAAVLGGHSVRDEELKFGLAVVGRADPARLLRNSGVREGDRLVLTKPLGTGVLVNAFKFDKLDEAGLEPALAEMERLNAGAAKLALEHEAHAATDITGFGLAGHAFGMAKASGVGLEIAFDDLPVHERFFELVERGVTTGCTAENEDNVAAGFEERKGLSKTRRQLLFDPQTSGGLLIAVREEASDALLEGLVASGHRAAIVGRAVAGPPRLIVI